MMASFIIKTATVADLRNHFRRVSAWLEEGGPVEITRNGRAFARLVPAAQAEKKKIVWSDFAAQRKEICGNGKFSDEEVAEMRAYELKGQEG